MKLYIKTSTTQGLIGIWWYYDEQVIGDAIPISNGFNDHGIIGYDEIRNHSTEWRNTLKTQLPEYFDKLYPLGYKGLERGRVIYDVTTQSYTILCSKAISQDIKAISQIVKFFNLGNCRCDVVPKDHYYLAELTGNPALDNFNYGVFGDD